MKSEKNKSWNDLLFKNRNKAYGAYDLRKNEGFNLLKSLFTGLFFIGTLMFIFSFTIKKDLVSEEPLKKPTIVNLIPIIEKPERPKTVSPPKVKVKKENTVKKDHIPDPKETPKKETPIKDNRDLGTIVMPDGPDNGNYNGTILNGSVGSAGNSQTETDGPEKPKPEIALNARDVKFMAVYPGCEKMGTDKSALQECMSRNLQKELNGQMDDFSKIAVVNKIEEANAKLLFVVDRKGRIVQVEALKGGNSTLGAESKKALERIAEKLARKGKYIKPAKLDDGTEVNIKLSIPIRFKLN